MWVFWYLCIRKNYSIGIKVLMVMVVVVISFQLMFVKKIIKMFEVVIKIEVLRLGCFVIKMVGMNIIINEVNKVLNDGGRVCLLM